MAIVERVETTAGERERLGLRSPATLEPIGEIEVMSAQDVRAACERARKVQPEWAALSVEERANYLQRALSLFVQRQDEIIDTVVRETGKSRSEAIQM